MCGIAHPTRGYDLGLLRKKEWLVELLRQEIVVQFNSHARDPVKQGSYVPHLLKQQCHVYDCVNVGPRIFSQVSPIKSETVKHFQKNHT